MTIDEVQESSGEGDSREGPESALPEKQLPVPRRVALLVALAVVGVLALGWAVDGFTGFAPAVHFANGESQQAGPYRVALTLDPAEQRVGQVEHVSLDVNDHTGRPVSDLQVLLRLSMITMEMPEITTIAKSAGNGIYTATATASMPGEWRLTAVLTPTSGSAVTTTFDLVAS